MMLEVSKIFWILGSQGAQLQLTFTEFPVPETSNYEHQVKIPHLREKAKEQQKEHGGTAPGKPKTLSMNSYKVSEPIDTIQAVADKFETSRQTATRGDSCWGESVFVPLRT